LRQRLGDQARCIVHSRFDLHRQTRGLEQLYEAVL